MVSSKSPSLTSPNWPNQRGIQRYFELCGKDFLKGLSEHHLWLDLGAGKGVALLEGHALSPCRKVGFSMHPAGLKAPIEERNGKIPSDPELLKEFFGTIARATDIYGPFSYADNPAVALIYQTLLLQPGGELWIITRPERLGTPGSLGRFQGALEMLLGVSISFTDFQTISDASETMSGALRIHVQRPNSGLKFSILDFGDLIRRHLKVLGQPSRVKPAWVSQDGQATIWELEYPKTE